MCHPGQDDGWRCPRETAYGAWRSSGSVPVSWVPPTTTAPSRASWWMKSSVVWELHCCSAEITASGEDSPVHSWRWASLPPGNIQYERQCVAKAKWIVEDVQLSTIQVTACLSHRSCPGQVNGFSALLATQRLHKGTFFKKATAARNGRLKNTCKVPLLNVRVLLLVVLLLDILLLRTEHLYLYFILS